jgi:hypothetical protein
MNGKLSRLIKKYCKVTAQPDYRKYSTAIRPEYVIKRKLKQLNGQDRLDFINEMKNVLSSKQV